MRRLASASLMKYSIPNWEDNAAPKYVSEQNYWESKSHKGDWMTKELPPKDFKHALELAGFVNPA